MGKWSPERIRELRGDLEREEFAELVGVSTLTIYRWELPEDAKESRRPRTGSRKRLEQVRRSLESERRFPTSFPPASHGFAGRQPERTAPHPGSTSDINDDLPETFWEKMGPLPRIFRLLMNAQFSQVEDALVDVLTSGVLEEPAGRVFALMCTGYQALLARNDPRSALTSVSGLVVELSTQSIPRTLAAKGYALAALVFASADGKLFSPTKVGRYADQVRSLAGSDETDSLALVAVAEAWTAFHQGHKGAFVRVLERNRAVVSEASALVPRMMGVHLLALASALDGFQPDACRRLKALADEAHELGFYRMECRALARLCMASHISGVSRPHIALLTERFHKVSQEAGLLPGHADLVLLAAEAEVMHGLGRFDEAQACVDKALSVGKRLGWPPADILMVQTRLAFHMYGIEGVTAAVRTFEQDWQALNRPSIDACIRYFNGLDESFQGNQSEAIRLFNEAFELACATGVRPWLEHFSISLSVASSVFSRREHSYQRALHLWELTLERLPSPWFHLFRNHILGMALSFEGREIEARQLLESSAVSFDLIGEVTETVRIRRSLAIAMLVLGNPEAEALLDASEKEMARLGIDIAPLHTRESAKKLAREVTEKHTDLTKPYAALVVPFQRITLRGMDVEVQLQELVKLARQLSEGKPVHLCELGVDGIPMKGGEYQTSKERFSFGDGCGRRFLLVVEGDLTSEQRSSIQLLVITAALSLEVNTLRALSKPKAAEAPAVSFSLPDVIAASSAMRHLLEDIQRLGNSRATVMIHGESGTGKEVVAQAVHELSGRKSGPYITFNSTAVPENLFEGQLFGYKKGAFTGATKNHPGVIRAANGGTLFLDEIGDLPLAVQPKLLRFLENQEVFPLGETRSYPVDVRVIAATHRNLEKMVEEGTFREDLYYRLNVVPLEIPPLRARRDDVLPLTRHFVKRFTPEEENTPSLSPDAMVALLGYTWPGNVRELRNVIERTLAFSPLPKVLLPEHFRLSQS